MLNIAIDFSFRMDFLSFFFNRLTFDYRIQLLEVKSFFPLTLFCMENFAICLMFMSTTSDIKVVLTKN